MSTTWKQIVHDTADVYREITGTTDKVKATELANLIREGGGKEDLDDVLIEQDAELTALEKELEGKAILPMQEVVLDPVPEGSVHEFLDFVANKVTLNPFQGSEGQHVWRKMKRYIISFTQEGTTGVYQCSSDDIDLSTVSEDWFIGTSGTITTSSVSYEFQENNVFKGTSAGLTYSYDPTTQKMTISYGSAGTRTMSDGVKDEFIDFVVSDDSTAYPDGGEQDGYWYESVVEDANDIDYGEVILTADASSIVVEHALKEMPLGVILYATSSRTGTLLSFYPYNGSGTLTATNTGNLSASQPWRQAETVTFYAASQNYPFKAGAYKWIVWM